LSPVASPSASLWHARAAEPDPGSGENLAWPRMRGTRVAEQPGRTCWRNPTWQIWQIKIYRNPPGLAPSTPRVHLRANLRALPSAIPRRLLCEIVRVLPRWQSAPSRSQARRSSKCALYSQDFHNNAISSPSAFVASAMPCARVVSRWEATTSWQQRASGSRVAKLKISHRMWTRPISRR